MSDLPELNRDELLRRLPEIELIETSDIREQVEEAFLDHCPDYFWTAPASSSGKYHQTDVVDEHGLWLHTKRVFTIVERISRSVKYQGVIDQEEHDVMRASILLHDLFKQGLPPRDTYHTSDDHDRIAKNYLGRKMDIDQRILGCIDSHNGGWKEGKNPENDLEHLHHLADMIGSDRNLIGKVYKPCKEIKEIFDKELFQKEGVDATF